MRREQALAMVKMGRLAILPGGFLAYCLGVTLAYYQLGTVDWQRALLALVLTLAANLAAHYADEYADVDTDSVTRRTWFSGGSGVLPAGIVPPSWALHMALLCVALVIVLGGWWIAVGALPPAAGWIVGVGTLGGWFYSMPPLALERHGLRADQWRDRRIPHASHGLCCPDWGFLSRCHSLLCPSVLYGDVQPPGRALGRPRRRCCRGQTLVRPDRREEGSAASSGSAGSDLCIHRALERHCLAA
jgi:hypothetical protein